MNRDLQQLRDINRACEKIASYISGGKEAFLLDERTQDAVIRNLEIIGEAARHLAPETKAKAPHEPWRQISGMRDKLIHQYFGVNLDLVWETAFRVLPAFRISVLSLIEDLTSSS